jgi:hypothetical protein
VKLSSEAALTHCDCHYCIECIVTSVNENCEERATTLWLTEDVWDDHNSKGNRTRTTIGPS